MNGPPWPPVAKTPAHELLRLLTARVEELNRRGARARRLDPLSDVRFTLRQEGEEVEVVASYLSGHGSESAYVMEDRVAFRLSAHEARNVRFEKELFVVREDEVVPLTGKGTGAFAHRVAAFLEGALPG